ncbi:MAG: hypothetical protein B7Z83_07390 [Thiomonas sp. 20-64-5]|nr:MAG: hypothetical protein B7Z83_07390 [Thiomonas sp. 20-64-5]
MKPIPPQHVILPVLTERLQSADTVIEDDMAAPFVVQPSAYADAVYRGPEHLQPLSDAGERAPGVDADQLWAQIAPELRQRLLEQVRAELDALVPQIAANLFQSLEQTLRAALAQALKPQ